VAATCVGGGPMGISHNATGSPTSLSTADSYRRLPACQIRVNVFERSSPLIELQGSLILVNFSVLPDRLKVYLPAVLHVVGEPAGAAACANAIVVPETVYFPLAIFVPLSKSVSVPEWNTIFHTPLRLAGFLTVAWNVPEGPREVLARSVLAKAGVAPIAMVSVATTTGIQRLYADTPNRLVMDGDVALELTPGRCPGSDPPRMLECPEIVSSAATFANSRGSIINGSFRRSQVMERLDTLCQTGWFVRPSMTHRQQNGVVPLTLFRGTADAVPVLPGYRDSGTAGSHPCWPAKGVPAGVAKQSDNSRVQ
jgi:hypothetical protein